MTPAAISPGSALEQSETRRSCGVGVLDKVDALLTALSEGPATLRDAEMRTGLPRGTVHRIASALEHTRMIVRAPEDRYEIGTRVHELAESAERSTLDLNLPVAQQLLDSLRTEVSLNAYLFVKTGEHQFRCIAASMSQVNPQRASPVGRLLTSPTDPVAQVFLAWSGAERIASAFASGGVSPFVLSTVRRQGWARRLAATENQIASIAAPVQDATGYIMAAASLVGPSAKLDHRSDPTAAKALLETAEVLASTSETR